MKNSNVCYFSEQSYNKEDFCDVVELMADSPYHKKFTVQDIMRTVVPPLQLGQYNLFRSQNKPLGYVSWAWLTPTAGLGYVTRQRRLKPIDWNAGNQLWVISVIGLSINPRKIIRFLRDKFENTQEKAYWHRAKNNHKLGVKLGRV